MKWLIALALLPVVLCADSDGISINEEFAAFPPETSSCCPQMPWFPKKLDALNNRVVDFEKRNSRVYKKLSAYIDQANQFEESQAKINNYIVYTKLSIYQNGLKGEKGALGQPGEIGDTGEPGFPGSSGQTGRAGPRGYPGNAGPPGDGGDNGSKGPKGPIGAQGLSGQPILGADGNPTCPDGWTYFAGSNKCYKVFLNAINWDDAEETCVESGGHLASIHSDAENTFIGNFAKDANADEDFPHQMWIGLRDYKDIHNTSALNDGWVWSDQSPTDFFDWAGGEPNNAGGEWCAQFYIDKTTGTSPIHFHWNDYNCLSTMSKYICEIGSLVGDQGETGQQGPAGDNGPEGAIGTKGGKGYTGRNGPRGPRGPDCCAQKFIEFDAYGEPEYDSKYTK